MLGLWNCSGKREGSAWPFQVEKLRDREKWFASQPGVPNETRDSSWACYLPAHSQRLCGFTFSLPQFSFYRKKQ